MKQTLITIGVYLGLYAACMAAHGETHALIDWTCMTLALVGPGAYQSGLWQQPPSSARPTSGAKP